jgi:hypothetical protein
MQLNLKDSHWGGCCLGNQITLILALAKVSLAPSSVFESSIFSAVGAARIFILGNKMKRWLSC